MINFTPLIYFLLSTFFSLITFILWGRLFIRFFLISRFLPLSQSIYRLTNPVITPIQKHLFHAQGSQGPYDWACLTLLCCVELLKFALFGFLFLTTALPLTYVALFTLTDLILKPCNIFFYAILIRTVISWFNPDWRHPFASILITITEPALRMIRRILPDLGMIDFSPLVAMIGLKTIELMVLGLLPFPMF